PRKTTNSAPPDPGLGLRLNDELRFTRPQGSDSALASADGLRLARPRGSYSTAATEDRLDLDLGGASTSPNLGIFGDEACPQHIAKGSMQSSSKDFKTKKIIVGELPSTLTEDDVKSFFARYGTMVDHQIMFDHETKRSRGFGFIVEIKKAEPKKSSNAPPPPPLYGRNARLAYDSGSRDHPSANNYGGMPNAYANYRGGGFGPYRSDTGFGGRLGNYGGTGDFGSTYGRYYAGLGGYGATTVLSFDYHNRFGLYGGGFGGAYAGADL
ncbi:hypothetical protein ACJX0J_008212, partial [Zea mays]